MLDHTFLRFTAKNAVTPTISISTNRKCVSKYANQSSALSLQLLNTPRAFINLINGLANQFLNII